MFQIDPTSLLSTQQSDSICYVTFVNLQYWYRITFIFLSFVIFVWRWYQRQTERKKRKIDEEFCQLCLVKMDELLLTWSHTSIRQSRFLSVYWDKITNKRVCLRVEFDGSISVLHYSVQCLKELYAVFPPSYRILNKRVYTISTNRCRKTRT